MIKKTYELLRKQTSSSLWKELGLPCLYSSIAFISYQWFLLAVLAYFLQESPFEHLISSSIRLKGTAHLIDTVLQGTMRRKE